MKKRSRRFRECGPIQGQRRQDRPRSCTSGSLFQRIHVRTLRATHMADLKTSVLCRKSAHKPQPKPERNTANSDLRCGANTAMGLGLTNDTVLLVFLIYTGSNTPQWTGIGAFHNLPRQGRPLHGRHHYRPWRRHHSRMSILPLFNFMNSAQQHFIETQKGARDEVPLLPPSFLSQILSSLLMPHSV